MRVSLSGVYVVLLSSVVVEVQAVVAVLSVASFRRPTVVAMMSAAGVRRRTIVAVMSIVGVRWVPILVSVGWWLTASGEVSHSLFVFFEILGRNSSRTFLAIAAMMSC